MIGLAGSHSTGKTTLARAYAENVGIPFVEGRVSAVFREMGIDSGAAWGRLPLSVRMDVQERVLAEHLKLYQAHSPGAFITDRTPVDFVAYTMADVRPEQLTPELEMRLKRYYDDCMDAVMRHFSLLVVLQPCPEIKPVPREGRGELSPFFIEKINHLIMGLVRDDAFKTRCFYMPRSVHSPEDRLLALRRCAEKVTAEFVALMSTDTDRDLLLVH